MNTIFWGKVRKGNQRGKSLGFPTANLNLSKRISEGIYVSVTKLNKIVYQSITFIGSAKTFDEHTYQAETYILNFTKDIYSQWISVKLLKKLRNNKKFVSVGELVKQMSKDKKETKDYFKHLG